MSVVIGNKRICTGCAGRFYDLGKNPAACPKCKTMNDINAPVKIRRKAKAVLEVDNDDPLIKNKAKQDAKKLKKPVKKVEGVDLEDFDDIAPMDGEDEIEELDEIDDIDDLEELEDAEPEEEMDDDIVLDDDSLIDDLEEIELEELEEDAEDEPAPAKKPSGKKSGKK